jgi:hypothetical protein
MPWYAVNGSASSLPSNVRKLTGARFDHRWAAGLVGLLEALRGHGIVPTLTTEQGRQSPCDRMFQSLLPKILPRPVMRTHSDTGSRCYHRLSVRARAFQ